MMLPPQLSPGMVAWATVAVNGSSGARLQPMCILSAVAGIEVGAFSPFVRVSEHSSGE